MTQKKLVKKTVITSKQEGLSESDRIDDCQAKVNAHIKYPTIVPGLSPTAASVQTILDGINTNAGKRTDFLKQAQDCTILINNDLDEIKGIIVDKWCKQVQDAIGTDTDKAKLLNYGIKGVYDGHAEPEYNVTNSHAEITDLKVSSHLAHTLFIMNNKTGTIGILDDAKGIDVFYYIGNDKPKDTSRMTYLGRATSGKFTAHFTEDQVGQMVWYYVVYVPRKKGVVAELGKMESAIVA